MWQALNVPRLAYSDYERHEKGVGNSSEVNQLAGRLGYFEPGIFGLSLFKT